MGPRQCAGENPILFAMCWPPYVASMGPRQCAGENAQREGWLSNKGSASMGPRQCAGENNFFIEFFVFFPVLQWGPGSVPGRTLGLCAREAIE